MQARVSFKPFSQKLVSPFLLSRIQSVQKKTVSALAAVDKFVPDIILKTQNSKLENYVDYLGFTFHIHLSWNLQIEKI